MTEAAALTVMSRLLLLYSDAATSGSVSGIHCQSEPLVFCLCLLAPSSSRQITLMGRAAFMLFLWIMLHQSLQVHADNYQIIRRHCVEMLIIHEQILALLPTCNKLAAVLLSIRHCMAFLDNRIQYAIRRSL